MDVRDGGRGLVGLEAREGEDGRMMVADDEGGAVA